MKILFLLMLIMSFQMFAQDTGNPRAEVVEDDDTELESRAMLGDPSYQALLLQYKQVMRDWRAHKSGLTIQQYRIQVVSLKIQLMKMLGKPTKGLEARLQMYIKGRPR